MRSEEQGCSVWLALAGRSLGERVQRCCECWENYRTGTAHAKGASGPEREWLRGKQNKVGKPRLGLPVVMRAAGRSHA